MQISSLSRIISWIKYYGFFIVSYLFLQLCIIIMTWLYNNAIRLVFWITHIVLIIIIEPHVSLIRVLDELTYGSDGCRRTVNEFKIIWIHSQT